MGSSVQRNMHRCLQEQTMHINSMELLAATRSSNEDVLEGCFRDCSTPTVGQCHSNGLHQQHERYSIDLVDRAGEGAMAVQFGQWHLLVCSTHSGGVKHHSRCRILRSLRLDASLSHLPTVYSIQQSIWYTGSRSVCLKTD